MTFRLGLNGGGGGVITPCQKYTFGPKYHENVRFGTHFFCKFSQKLTFVNSLCPFLKTLNLWWHACIYPDYKSGQKGTMYPCGQLCQEVSRAKKTRESGRFQMSLLGKEYKKSGQSMVFGHQEGVPCPNFLFFKCFNNQMCMVCMGGIAVSGPKNRKKSQILGPK